MPSKHLTDGLTDLPGEYQIIVFSFLISPAKWFAIRWIYSPRCAWYVSSQVLRGTHIPFPYYGADTNLWLCLKWVVGFLFLHKLTVHINSLRLALLQVATVHPQVGIMKKTGGKRGLFKMAPTSLHFLSLTPCETKIVLVFDTMGSRWFTFYHFLVYVLTKWVRNGFKKCLFDGIYMLVVG